MTLSPRPFAALVLAIMLPTAAVAAGPRRSGGGGPAQRPGPAAPAPVPDELPPPSDEVIGLLDVQVEGVSPTAGEMLTRAIAEEVARTGYMAVLPARLREAMAVTPWNSACLIGACLIELDQAAAVGRVLHAKLVSTGSNYEYVVTLISTATGLPIAQIVRTCDVCTTEEALAATAHAAVELAVQGSGIEPPRHDRPRPRRGGRPVRPSPAPRWRRAGLMLVGSAVVVGAGGFILRGGTHPDLGAGALGAAATLGVAGTGCLAMSFRF